MKDSNKRRLSSENFSDNVFKHKELTIVQFHDDDNVSCQIMDSVFDKVQEFYGSKIVCYNIHKTEGLKIWEGYKINQIPTYLFVQEKKAVEIISGLISYDGFIQVVKKFI